MAMPAPSHQPRQGRDRLDHAREIMEILEQSPYGNTIDESIWELYTRRRSRPPTGAQLDYERAEAKRSVSYINERFKKRVPGWVWVRTRRRPPNKWIYMAVAKMARDDVVRLIDAAVSVESYERYYKDWTTRTETVTRMQVLDIDARYEAALLAGDADAAKRIEAELDNLKVISPRLGLMYFGAGLADENLEILENDPRARHINRQIKHVRLDLKRLQRSTAKLGTTVESVLRIRGLI